MQNYFDETNIVASRMMQLSRIWSHPWWCNLVPYGIRNALNLQQHTRNYHSHRDDAVKTMMSNDEQKVSFYYNSKRIRWLRIRQLQPIVLVLVTTLTTKQSLCPIIIINQNRRLRTAQASRARFYLVIDTEERVIVHSTGCTSNTWKMIIVF